MRPTLELSAIAEPALARMKSFHPDIVANVKAAIAKERIVVIGMKQNPVVRRVRKVLAAAGYEFTYIEYGSYLTMWKERLAIKLWSGWPTYPQVFVRGKLVGGCAETEKALADGNFVAMLETH